MKKFLSLVLALTMTMSMATVGAGAKDFTDDSKIQYKEAVDVMSAVKVIDGYTDGSFQPTTNLTRGAAAKIICNLILGPTTASALGADTAPYKDVPTSNVFAGYIAYCQKEGIISGYADGTFRPSAPLTGYAFMKMLLGALGYDSSKEGYTGANWSVNVAKQAIAIGLNKGNDDFVGQDTVNREEAMLYAFNTMKTTMVEYGNDTTITVGDVVVSQSGKATKVANNTKTDGNIDDDDYMQFAEAYFADLTLNKDYNALQQVTNKWKVKSDVVGTYAVEADSVAVVADKNKTINDILTGSSYMDYSSSDIDVTYRAAAGDGADDSAHVYVNGDQQAMSGALNTPLTKGDVVYAYENSDGDVVRVVVARYTYAKIDSVSEKVTATEKDNGAAYRVKLVKQDGSNWGTYYDDYDASSKKLVGFDAATYDEGAVLAIAVGSGSKIVDSYVVEAVTGKPSAVTEGANGSITVDGTKYYFAGTPVGVSSAFDFDNEYAVYTTAEGYVFAIEGATAANLEDLYYVTGFYKETSGGEDAYFAQRVNLVSGEVDTVQLEEGALKAINSSIDITTSLDETSNFKAGLYTFNDKKDSSLSPEAKANNDILTIVAADSDSAVIRDFEIDDDSTLDSGAAKVDVKDTNVVLADGRKVYMNADTKQLSVEGKGSKIDVSTAVGGMKITASEGTDVSVLVIFDKDDTKTALAMIYVADTGDMNVSGNTNDVVYLPKTPDNRVSADNWAATLYQMDDNTSIDTVISDNDAQGFYTYGVKDDVYTLESGAENLLGKVTRYDDETGYVENLIITSVYSKNGVNTLTGANGSFSVTDADLKDTLVIDNRSASAIDASSYGLEITDIAGLVDALKEADQIVADVYFNDGVTFIAVDALIEDEVDADTIDSEIDSLADGLYVDSSSNASSNTSSTIADNGADSVVLFKYTADGDSQTYTLTLSEVAGGKVVQETSSAKSDAEHGSFYFDVYNDAGDKKGYEGEIVLTEGVAYTFKIVGDTDGNVVLSGSFVYANA